MPVTKLRARAVERVWGRTRLPAGFESLGIGSEPIGEIWHEGPDSPSCDLLVKHLFTSDRLSIQVHPDDEAARARGHPCGKDEAWLVLDAEPGAVIGLGLRHEVSPDELRSAALDGSIERLIDWKPVSAGDFFYSPAGTIHAIGDGLSLIEIQQNLDLTYRLYDYGRPRELHLDEAVAVAKPEPWQQAFPPEQVAPGRQVLAAGGRFVVERAELASSLTVSAGDEEVLLIVVSGQGSADGVSLERGAVLSVSGGCRVEIDEPAELLASYPGSEWRADVFQL